MNAKTEIIAEKIVGIIKAWPSVDSILIGKLISEEFYDPYYFLSLDVYYTDAIPLAAKRGEEFRFGAVIETSQVNGKDRLIVEEVPVRINYKSLSRITELVENKNITPMRGSGSYIFYRILNSGICYDRSGWIVKIRKELQDMPEFFWDNLRSAFQSRMEHCLSDLGAASIRNDELFFLISAGNFLQSVCSVLFAVNKRFEPSFRLFSEQVKTLSVLPEAFVARFDTLLRSGSDFTPSRKYEIAELLAKSILNL
jgi:hypothetical protein